MAMLQQIALTKFHPQAYQHDTETTTLGDMIDPHLEVTIAIGITTVTIKIGTGSADLDLAPIILDIGVTVAVTLAEVALDPFTHLMLQHIMPQKLEHIQLPKRHATPQILITQEFIQRKQ